MTNKEKALILKLVDRLVYSYDHAHKAFQRYTWHPGTDTGQKDFDRYEKWDQVFEDTRKELYELLKEEK